MKLGGNVSKGILFFSRMDKNGCFVVVFPFSFSFLYAAGTVYCHLSCDHIRYSGINDAKTFGFEKSHFLKKYVPRKIWNLGEALSIPDSSTESRMERRLDVQRKSHPFQGQAASLSLSTWHLTPVDRDRGSEWRGRARGWPMCTGPATVCRERPEASAEEAADQEARVRFVCI